MMLKLVRNAREEVLPEFCPSCFIELKGDMLPGGLDCNIHSNPVCASNWYRHSREEQRVRVAEAKRIARTKWLDRPTSEGTHWARIPGCGVPRQLHLVRRLGELVVTSGEQFVPLSSFNRYEFLAKVA